MILEGFDRNNRILEGKKLFLVCGKTFDKFECAEKIKIHNPIRFSDFTPNPLYEDVMRGVEQFKNSGCDSIIAVGGGSAIDVAKGIKYYSKSDAEIIAIPTTAGTGAEVTKFAVIYRDGIKQSISEEKLLPEIAILEPSMLKHMPDYIRKVTMMDALCHAIESYWSKKSTQESRKYAVDAIQEIMTNMEQYLRNEEKGNAGMLRAANLAGRAINITTTTAAHAMSYKLTSIYGLAHGHAVSICLPEVWDYNKTDIPGITRNEFVELVKRLQLEYPISQNRDYDIAVLVDSVNTQRLDNNPVELDRIRLKGMYERIIQ